MDLYSNQKTFINDEIIEYFKCEVTKDVNGNKDIRYYILCNINNIELIKKACFRCFNGGDRLPEDSHYDFPVTTYSITRLSNDEYNYLFIINLYKPQYYQLITLIKIIYLYL